jgi:NADH-quinone oxidoreductase subunit F
VPAWLADTPVDYESLARAGTIMGSGGLIVLDDEDCMVDVARYFLSFLKQESCGACSFCRIGTARMLEILEAFCEGKAKPGDLDDLEELAKRTSQGSLCGLGRTASNPVLTTLRYFRGEYEAHMHGHCPAGKCKNLIRYKIEDNCIGCTVCAQRCPSGAIDPLPFQKHSIDSNKCVRCDACRIICPETAIRIVQLCE